METDYESLSTLETLAVVEKLLCGLRECNQLGCFGEQRKERETADNNLDAMKAAHHNLLRLYVENS